MKRAVFIAICMLVAGAAWSQSDADYRTWMKTIGATCGSLKKNLDAKNGRGRGGGRAQTPLGVCRRTRLLPKKAFGRCDEIRNGCFRGIRQDRSAGFQRASLMRRPPRSRKPPPIAAAAIARIAKKAADGSFKIKY